jgi:hypothetical protein
MMRGKSTFLALVVVQALHSVEEYVFHAYDTFPPVEFVTGLISRDPEWGFVIANLAIVGFGIACYWWPVRRGWPSAVPLAWFWVVVELVNGIGHPAWSLVNGGYTPGLVTAVLLLLLALPLARQLLRRDNRLKQGRNA